MSQFETFQTGQREQGPQWPVMEGPRRSEEEHERLASAHESSSDFLASNGSQDLKSAATSQAQRSASWTSDWYPRRGNFRSAINPAGCFAGYSQTAGQIAVECQQGYQLLALLACSWPQNTCPCTRFSMLLCVDAGRPQPHSRQHVGGALPLPRLSS